MKEKLMQLMQEAEAWAKAQGITSMRLNSGAGRKEAQRVYGRGNRALV